MRAAESLSTAGALCPACGVLTSKLTCACGYSMAEAIALWQAAISATAEPEEAEPEEGGHDLDLD